MCTTNLLTELGDFDLKEFGACLDSGSLQSRKCQIAANFEGFSLCVRHVLVLADDFGELEGTKHRVQPLVHPLVALVVD